MNRMRCLLLGLALLPGTGCGSTALPYNAWKLGFASPDCMDVWVETAEVKDVRGRPFFNLGVGTTSDKCDGQPAGWSRMTGKGPGKYVEGAALPERIYVRWQSLAEPQTYELLWDVPERVRRRMLEQKPAFVNVPRVQPKPLEYQQYPCSPSLQPDHDGPHVLHSSLRLFALTKPSPRPGVPDWREVACVPHDGLEYLLTFLSPVDAFIERRWRNQDGSRYQVCPFVAIHPQHFLETHGQQLNMAIVYGYAASRGRVMTYRDSRVPASMVVSKCFPIPREAGCHFHLWWADTHAVLSDCYEAAGLVTYARTLDELATMPARALDKFASEAIEQAGGPFRSSHAGEFAIYDTKARRWRFTDLDLLRAHGSA